MSVYDRCRAMEDRQKRSAVQVRMKNLQEKRNLDERVVKIDSDLEKNVFDINKSMFNIRYDLKDMSEIPSSILDEIPCEQSMNKTPKKKLRRRRTKMEPSTGGEDVVTQVQILAGNEIHAEDASNVKEDRINDGLDVSNGDICKYRIFDRNHKCSYFPCKKPETYSHISDIGGNLRTPDDDILLGQPAYMSNNKLNDTRIKEKALRSMIKEMRLKNLANKPVDRCISYGTPISFRKMTTVARPSVSE